jgi:hypothetical protein
MFFFSPDAISKNFLTFVPADHYDQLLQIPQVRKKARVSGCSGAIIDLPFFF